MIDAPAAVWLVYGDIERADTHATLAAAGDVGWCEEQQYQSDVRYVRADEAALLEHKIITCGVAASHPDHNLSFTGAYATEWNSPQADAVRKLRAEVVERLN